VRSRSEPKLSRHYAIRGRVQGVGYRYFVEHSANAIGVEGWVRNMDDGRVEVHACGTPDQLSAFEGLLWKGPRWAEVRGVEAVEAAPEKIRGFEVRH
jgi:acylphosphatase